jgi:hypothetical protein
MVLGVVTQCISEGARYWGGIYRSHFQGQKGAKHETSRSKRQAKLRFVTGTHRELGRLDKPTLSV